MGIEGIFVFSSFFLLCVSQMQRNDSIIASSNSEEKKKLVLLLSSFYFLIGALRSYSTGIDTYWYVMRFKNEYSGVGIFKSFQNFFGSDFSGESGFEFLSSLFGSIIPNAQLWLAFLWLIFVFVCTKLILKYSDCPPFSYLYLVSCMITTFLWQGLRQSIAITICLISYEYFLRRKYIKAVLLIVLAFYFHRSAVIFLLAIPALIMPVGIISFVIIFLFLFLAVFASLTVISNIVEVVNVLQIEDIIKTVNGYVSNVNTRSGTLSYFFVLFALFTFCFIVKNELIAQNKTNKFLLNLSMFGVCLQSFSIIIPEFFRISFYFSIFNMLLLPKTCMIYQEKYPKIGFRVILVLLLIIMFFWVGGFNYWFCWQQEAW